jgi:hypothetical protein
MLLEKLPIVELELPGAQSFEDLISAREIWFVVFHQTTYIFENVTLSIQDGSHPRIDRQSSEVAAPGHPRTREILLQRAEKVVSWPRDGEWRAWVRARDNA